MRNGIHFSKLVLVDGTEDAADDAASYYPYRPDDQPVYLGGSSTQRTFLTFLAISITCAAATVISGSYAVWLLRHQAAQQALTDVNDILRSCQSRMSQLEADVRRLPGREAEN